jgi:hypothetical protein
MFNVAQRGAGPWTASVYTLDRWALALVSDAISIIQFPVNDTDRAQIGDESARSLLGNTFTGNAAAGAFSVLFQRIEGVRRLAGKTVTVSFYARAGGATKLGVGMDQDFGSGGSPSAIVLGTGQPVTLSTTWARYSLTFTLPSAAGKTLGTNGNDSTTVNFWYSSGTGQAARAGNIGVQSGTVDLWGVQLEVGTVATPLEKPDPELQLRQCQRFYQTNLMVFAGSYGVAASNAVGTGHLHQSMRATPTITPGTDSSVNVGARTLNVYGNTVWVSTAAVATGAWSINVQFTASADL